MSGHIPYVNDWRRALSTWYGEPEVGALAAKAQARLNDLYGDRKRYDSRALRFHVENNILPGLALYQTLRETGLDSRTAFERVSQVWESVFAAQRRRVAWMAKLPFFFDLFRFTVRLMMKTLFPPGHWDTEWIEDSPQRLAFNIHHCFYLDVLNGYGAPELTPVFCASDDVMIAAFSSRVIWERKTTLGRGGDQCDFCYRRATPQPS